MRYHKTQYYTINLYLPIVLCTHIHICMYKYIKKYIRALVARTTFIYSSTHSRPFVCFVMFIKPLNSFHLFGTNALYKYIYTYIYVCWHINVPGALSRLCTLERMRDIWTSYLCAHAHGRARVRMSCARFNMHLCSSHRNIHTYRVYSLYVCIFVCRLSIGRNVYECKQPQYMFIV